MPNSKFNIKFKTINECESHLIYQKHAVQNLSQS